MRKIEFIVLHCTATPQDTTVPSIIRYWKNVLGWRNPGYHYLIEANGIVHELQPLHLVANGVAGHNHNSIHISYIGGVAVDNTPRDNRTPQQRLQMIRILIELKAKYPQAVIQGHRDFQRVAKACPSFDVKGWLRGIGLEALI